MEDARADMFDYARFARLLDVQEEKAHEKPDCRHILPPRPGTRGSRSPRARKAPPRVARRPEPDQAGARDHHVLLLGRIRSPEIRGLQKGGLGRGVFGEGQAAVERAQGDQRGQHDVHQGRSDHPARGLGRQLTETLGLLTLIGRSHSITPFTTSSSTRPAASPVPSSPSTSATTSD